MTENYFFKKSRIIFYQFLALSLGFILILFSLARHLYPSVFLLGQSFLGQLAESCGCTYHFSFGRHPFIFSGLIGLGLGGGLFLGIIAWKILKIRNATKKFIQANLRKRKPDLSPKLKKAARLVNLENCLIEIKETKPVIFCYRFFRPKICVSSSIVKKLYPEELAAVLRHEKQHFSAHDPIKIFFLKIISRVLFFVPGLEFLARQYAIFSELAADGKATNDFREKAHLARALGKILRWQERLILKNNLAISFFTAGLDERINKLTDSAYSPSHKLFNFKFFINSFFLLTLFFSFNFLLSFGHSFLAAQKNNQCSPSRDSTFGYCSLNSQSSICSMAEEVGKHSCSPADK